MYQETDTANQQRQVNKEQIYCYRKNIASKVNAYSASLQLVQHKTDEAKRTHIWTINLYNYDDVEFHRKEAFSFSKRDTALTLCLTKWHDFHING